MGIKKACFIYNLWRNVVYYVVKNVNEYPRISRSKNVLSNGSEILMVTNSPSVALGVLMQVKNQKKELCSMRA